MGLTSNISDIYEALLRSVSHKEALISLLSEGLYVE